MADVHGSPAADGGQMRQAANSGPAPLPYAGADQSPEPPVYNVGIPGFLQVGDDVMSGISDTMGVQESAYAHDMNAGLLTPYVTSTIKSIYTGGDSGGAGGDDVMDTVAGAVTAAESRFAYHMEDTTNTGPGYIGDIMLLPASPLDPAVGTTGTTDPAGAYYDPPRNYGA